MTETDEIRRKIEAKRQAITLLSEDARVHMILIGRWERDIELLEGMLSQNDGN